MTTIVRGWPARLITLASALALAACQSAPQATPPSAASSAGASPEVTAAPSPTTEPVDVVKLFTDRADDFHSGVMTFEGTATVEPDTPRADRVEAYLAKYQTAIEGLGYEPGPFARTYSMAIRVRPTRVRAW